MTTTLDDLRLTNDNIARAKNDHEFRSLLLESNIQMIYDATGRQCSVKSPEYEDLFQESAIIFLRCIDTFDPSRGVKFSSLFYRSVFLKIRSKRVDEERKKHLKFSKYDYYNMSKVYSLRQQEPTLTEDEIAERLEMSLQEVRQALHANYTNKPISLDQITTEGDAHDASHTLAELITGEDDTEADVVESISKHERVTKLMAILPDKYKVILSLLLEGKDQKTIAVALGISQNKVYKSLKKITSHYVPRINTAMDYQM